MEKTAPGWRSPGSPLFVEESYLGSINVLDPRQALHLPCTVTGLTVEGNKRTRREMIQREMRAAVEARTHAELAAGVSPRSAYLRSVPGCRCSVACAQYLSTPRRRRLPSPPLRRLLWPRLRKCPRRCNFTPYSEFCRRVSPVCTELLNAKSRLYDLDVFREATCHVDVGERDEVCMHHHSPDVSADNALAGSAGTSMLPWMFCRCVLGWSASSDRHPGAPDAVNA